VFCISFSLGHTRVSRTRNFQRFFSNAMRKMLVRGKECGAPGQRLGHATVSVQAVKFVPDEILLEQYPLLPRLPHVSVLWTALWYSSVRAGAMGEVVAKKPGKKPSFTSKSRCYQV
jgi:hypothetical protein